VRTLTSLDLGLFSSCLVRSTRPSSAITRIVGRSFEMRKLDHFVLPEGFLLQLSVVLRPKNDYENGTIDGGNGPIPPSTLSRSSLTSPSHIQAVRLVFQRSSPNLLTSSASIAVKGHGGVSPLHVLTHPCYITFLPFINSTGGQTEPPR
jgi:hypothetical protein